MGCAMPGICRRRLFLLAAAVLASAPGCTRKFFRERADKDVAGVLTQKNIFPDWVIKSWHVYPNPMARFADPSRPDLPPYPPDDFAARMISPNPQHPTKKSGTGRYEGDGYLELLAMWDAQNRGHGEGSLPDVEKLPQPKEAPGPKIVTEMSFGKFPRDGKPSLSETRSAPAYGSPARMASGTRLTAPTITESRDSGVIVAVGEIPDQNNKLIPAVMLIPAKEPPEISPEGDSKKVGEPGPFLGAKEKSGDEGPVAVVLTGDTASDYLKALATNEEGFRIKLDQAVELGLVNSREFQSSREDLYLSALPVTLQRYQFASQAFLAETIVRQNLGGEFPGGPRNFWQFGTDTGIGKLFPTGATMLVRLANQFVVDLSGNRPDVAVSNLSLSVAQPFLRGGGFAVTLEPLTQVERNLLYAIRSYARFRKLFYVAISAGGGYTNNPYGLAGLSVNLGRGIGNNLTAPSVGYMQLLLQAAIIANQKKNVAALEQLLQLYQAFREGGQQSDLQVGQVEQSLLGSRTQLLGGTGANIGSGGGGGSGIRGFLDNLDNFKLQLGVPLTTGIDLEDSPLQPIRQQLGRFEEVYDQVREVEEAARKFDPNEDNAAFRKRWLDLLTQSQLTKGTNFAKNVARRLARWEQMTDDQSAKELLLLAERRRKLLDERAARQLKGIPETDADILAFAELNADIDIGQFEQAVRQYVARPWLREPRQSARESIQAGAFRDVFNAFYLVVIEGRNERLAKTRQQWPKLPPIVVDDIDLLELSLDDAFTTGIQVALTNRLDLMNARGQVVDSWRQIKVQANTLQGVLDVRYDLNGVTPPGGVNPGAFSGARTSNTLTVDLELPLIRRAERNNYRAALIAYQRQRRTLMSFEDNIANDVRSDIRELRTIAELYRVQKRLVELGYSQVDNAQAILLAPPAAGVATDAGSAAALTNQVLQAQSSLLTAQNTLYNIWVNFLVSRMQLYLDLELMQVDDRGVWCDEYFSELGNSGSRQPSDSERAPALPGSERLPPPRVIAAPGRE